MRKRQLIYIIKRAMLFIVSVCILSSCQVEKDVKEFQKTDEILGTIITCKVYGEDGKEGLEKAFQRVKEIDAMMSAKLDNSELTKVNETAVKHPVKISDDLYKVIERALYFAEKTEGAFDPTIGKLIDIWGIGTEHPKVPTEKEIEGLRDKKNYKNVILEEQSKTIFFKNKDIKLDLGAIAKGYAGDEMKSILMDEFHIESGILSLGGNIVTIGNKLDGAEWKVGIVNPFETGKVYGTLVASGKAVVTSGNYERYFEKNGTRYHHIIDPKTGYPADAGVVSTTIYGECSMDADALSTACYIMGKEKTLQLLRTMEGYQGVLIETDGDVVKSYGLTEGMFKKIME